MQKILDATIKMKTFYTLLLHTSLADCGQKWTPRSTHTRIVEWKEPTKAIVRHGQRPPMSNSMPHIVCKNSSEGSERLRLCFSQIVNRRDNSICGGVGKKSTTLILT